MDPVESYLSELRDIRASGAAVPETSGYGALATLLAEVGGKLRPKVRCLINLQNAGAGIPDGGLFTANQFPKGITACLGGACYDVYLNERAYWRCVPARVWTYTIGGYQVMKKWLSYRERALLGRDLKVEEARYVSEMTRRIAAILLLEPVLDANYERVKADTYPWPGP